ncbi:MAG: N-acetylmuramoyl-L-alanine amidase [Alphaproteobacteria bacterium]|nr:N-acetylmuramoyl-L-alanine amidase [Alphaproteobacteria bacterium]
MKNLSVYALFAVIFLLTSWGYASYVHALELQKARFGAHPDKTRLVLELDQKTDFRAFALPAEQDKPYRLVIDLPDFIWNAGTVSRPKSGHVLDIRSGMLEPGIKRIVIDSTKPPQIGAAFFLPPSQATPTHRLVVDFTFVSASEFAHAKSKHFGTLRAHSGASPAPTSSASSHNLKSKNLEDVLASTAQNKLFDPSSIPAPQMVIPTQKPAVPANFKAGHFNTETSAPQTPLYKPLIVIDPGHGGADPGAIGANKSYEKHIALAAAKELQRKLIATGRYRAKLTRTTDKYLKLYRRVSIARQLEADLFISLHADSIDKPNVRGASIYTLSNKASDAQTAKLAARENQADLIAGVDLSHEDKDVANILIDLAMRDTMNQSKFFANTVVDHMRKKGIRILEKPHRYAGFAVLKAPDIPSVLVEIGFMSNRSEAKLLATRDYQQRIAAALSASIDSYFTKVHKNGL